MLFILVFLILPWVCHAFITLPPVNWTFNVQPSPFIFAPERHTNIYLQSSAADVRDTDGLTLIPPSAHEFTQTFADDLKSTFPAIKHVWILLVEENPGHGIYLSLDPDTERYTYESGVKTSEGYSIKVGENGVHIAGAGARGIWWGTRTLLQELVLAREAASNGSRKFELRAGEAEDSPAYPTRGFMLDAGRKWYSADFLKELCTYASWFRMSEFHYHASDNYPLNRGRNSTWQTIFSQFSLLPSNNTSLLPLVQRHNESHSRAEFDSIQRHCASRGITVVPEIETPGHALAITKWKPQLALARKADLLNLTHPETIPTVKAIWEEFLPWFHTKEVHIGADEYESSLADVYIHFVNTLSEFVYASSGKRSRIWGTWEPSNTSVISKDVIIQHWQYGQSDPVQLEKDGYQIINSEDWWAYTGLKNDHTPIFPAPYPQYFNNERVLNFAGVRGWQWEPSLYNPFNVSMQLPTDSKFNKGAIMATWNDNGPDASTQLEAFYCIRDGIPTVGARAWSGSRGPKLDVGVLAESRALLSANAPGQNLDRRIKSMFSEKTGSLLVDWKKPVDELKGEIGLGSKGMNYTMAIAYSSTPWRLSAPYDGIELFMKDDGALVFTADGFEYPLRSIDQADGYDPAHPGRIWTNVTSSTHEPVYIQREGEGACAEIIIRTDKIGGSRVWVGDVFKGRFEVFVYGGRNTLFSWSQMAFVAPLETVEGGVQRVRVWEGLVDEIE